MNIRGSVAALQALCLGLVACMCLALGLLIYEYSVMSARTQEFLELKEDYRNYVLAFKKVLDDYNTTRERMAELEAFAQEAKKNGIDVPCAASVFPGSVLSDRAEEGDEVVFAAVNRDLQYLRDAAYEFVMAQSDQGLLALFSTQEEWPKEQSPAQDFSPRVVSPDILDPSKRRRYSCQMSCQPHRHATSSGTHAPRKTQQTVAQAAAESKCDYAFKWPVDRKNFWLSSFFGPRKKPDGSWGFHYGLDMAAHRGTPVHAAASGIVLEAQYVAGYGNCVVIGHSRKYKTRYAHLHAIKVSVGAKVAVGTLIGTVGDTGFVRKSGNDASHLHFEVIAFGKQVNPLPFLRAS